MNPVIEVYDLRIGRQQSDAVYALRMSTKAARLERPADERYWWDRADALLDGVAVLQAGRAAEMAVRP